MARQTLSQRLAQQQEDLIAKEFALEYEAAIERSRANMLDFTTFTKPDYEVNWHHREICHVCDDILNGLLTRVIICAPPRNGKSELVSRRLPALALGKNPDLQIISCSYSADLSSRMNRDVQRIMDSQEYKTLFPGTRLNEGNVRTVAGSAMRNSDIFEVVGRLGAYRSAGVGGGITGMGAHLAVVDDPIKNQEEADSPVYREKVWDWYTSTLYTRLEKNGAILVTLTRWHEDDLAGRLIKHAKNNPDADQYKVVMLPAVQDGPPNEYDHRQMDEPLWPGKYSRASLRRIEAVVGPRQWVSLYMQKPSPKGGSVFKVADFKRYKELPALESFDDMQIHADLTFKDKEKSDFCVFQVWGALGVDRYLIDQIRSRMAFTMQISTAMLLSEKYPMISCMGVEDAANGAALVDLLKKKIAGLVAIPVKGTKMARAESVAPLIAAGQVYLPDESIAPWVSKYTHEFESFPNGKNDDQVDATSQALGYMRKNIAFDFSAIGLTKTSSFL